MPTYRLTELVEATGVPVRTIRYYQATGLLPKPERVGKEAVYAEEHRRRLDLIAEMQARGLKLGAIRDALTSSAPTRDSVADWLGLQQLRVSWPSEQNTASFTEAELADFAGDQLSEIRDELVADGHLVRQEDEDGSPRWYVPDLTVLRHALALYDLGIGVAVSTAAVRMMRRRMAGLADDLVDLVVRESGRGYAGEGTAAEIRLNIEQIRAVVGEGGGRMLAQEIERAVEDLGRDA